MRATKIALLCLLLCSVCAAVIVHTTLKYDAPLKQLRGRVTDYSGVPIPFVHVEVYDNPRVWQDVRLPFDQKRAKQHRVAIATTDERGAFKIGPLPEGPYEVQFSRMGWDILSVLMQIDHRSSGKKLCIELRISDGPGESKVSSCR